MGAYLPLDLDLSCYIVLLMWVGYTARHKGLEPSVSKPLLFIGAGIAWLVLAALSGLELSSRRVDGFVVATVAALAGSYCVCWVSMALEKLKDVPVLGAFERGLVFCGQADHASAYDAASIVALCITRAWHLRYWIGIRDQEGVITAGRTNLALPAVIYSVVLQSYFSRCSLSSSSA